MVPTPDLLNSKLGGLSLGNRPSDADAGSCLIPAALPFALESTSTNPLKHWWLAAQESEFQQGVQGVLRTGNKNQLPKQRFSGPIEEPWRQPGTSPNYSLDLCGWLGRRG